MPYVQFVINKLIWKLHFLQTDSLTSYKFTNKWKKKFTHETANSAKELKNKLLTFSLTLINNFAMHFRWENSSLQLSYDLKTLFTCLLYETFAENVAYIS